MHFLTYQKSETKWQAFHFKWATLMCVTSRWRRHPLSAWWHGGQFRRICGAEVQGSIQAAPTGNTLNHDYALHTSWLEDSEGPQLQNIVWASHTMRADLLTAWLNIIYYVSHQINQLCPCAKSHMSTFPSLSSFYRFMAKCPGDSFYNINNIVIHTLVSKMEKLQYKDIMTPRYGAPLSPRSLGQYLQT